MINVIYEGGFVCEVGFLFFFCVYQVGYSVGGYQFEILFVIFNCVLFGYDVVIGEIEILKNQLYLIEGVMSICDVKKDILGLDENVCYVFFLGEICINEQFEVFMNGMVEIKDWVVVDFKGIKGVDMDGVGGNGSGLDEEEGDDGNDGDNGGIVDEEDFVVKFVGIWMWVFVMGVIVIVVF